MDDLPIRSGHVIGGTGAPGRDADVSLFAALEATAPQAGCPRSPAGR